METILRPDAALSSALVGVVHHLGYPVGDNRVIPGLSGGDNAAKLDVQTVSPTIGRVD